MSNGMMKLHLIDFAHYQQPHQIQFTRGRILTILNFGGVGCWRGCLDWLKASPGTEGQSTIYHKELHWHYLSSPNSWCIEAVKAELGWGIILTEGGVQLIIWWGNCTKCIGAGMSFMWEVKDTTVEFQNGDRKHIQPVVRSLASSTNIDQVIQH